MNVICFGSIKDTFHSVYEHSCIVSDHVKLDVIQQKYGLVVLLSLTMFQRQFQVLTLDFGVFIYAVVVLCTS